MPIAGRKPIEDRSQARNRMPPAVGAEWTEVPNVEHDGPALGPRPESSSLAGERPLGVPAERWPQETLDWWEDVRTMPHAARWTRAEWRTARTAAEAHARFVEGWKGCASGSELRQREKLLGMTADARRDLRIRYVDPPSSDAELPANVTRVDFGAL